MSEKFEKRTNCEYCEKPLKAKYRSKRFCDDKCRIYFKRENDSKPKFVKASEIATAPIDFKDETPIFITPNPKKVFDSNKKLVSGDEMGQTLSYKPKSFDELLKEAKAGVSDKEAFRKEVMASRCTPGQKSMILSKLPND